MYKQITHPQHAHDLFTCLHAVIYTITDLLCCIVTTLVLEFFGFFESNFKLAKKIKTRANFNEQGKTFLNSKPELQLPKVPHESV